ncbi:Clathrin light chain [Coemansia sp. RSA 990]|nr:clathrin light chain-domain-containing protein [Coemansia mojavensis]KAJ1873440.1 Clathrin light chain [Coemansia sp. RSA 990]KAJ2647958.1 Clathrin light chain [Coemansia sp. RSA 1250]
MADDPMADFLARERAALGEDADMFQADSNTSPSQSVTSPLAAEQQPEAAGDVSAAMPNLASSEFASPSSSSSAFPQTKSPSQPQEKSQFEQDWSNKQQEIILERDRASESRHAEIVKEAREAIDKFYEEYNERKDKAIEENRASQEIEAQAANRGTLWERVLKQADMVAKATTSASSSTGVSERHASPAPFGSARQQSPQQQQQQQQQSARDTSRMRELLQDLRRDPNAPGVKKAEAAA